MCVAPTCGLAEGTVKTGRWSGVVTAFITMSDIKDEIDWEFPGNQTDQGQSNFFWQGFIRAFRLRCIVYPSGPDCALRL